jgi:GNAT superfamily N-acetyltransferase
MGYAARVSRFVVPYDDTHWSSLNAFQRLYFGRTSRQCDRRVFKWLFEGNPYRRDGAPALWLYIHEDEVVGQQGAIPVAVKVGDRELHAAWAIDLMVHPAWRLKGVAPALIDKVEASTEVCLGLGLADSARRLFLRRGWSDMGRLPSYVRLLRPRGFAPDSGAGTFLAKNAPPALFSGSARLLGKVWRMATQTNLDVVAEFDFQADRIWASASLDYPILVRRDYAALRWRFDEVPGCETYQRYYLRGGSDVLAYAVTRRDTLRGQPVIRIVDYLAPRRRLAALFASVIAESERSGAAAVVFEHLNAETSAVMRLLGCWKLPDSTQFVALSRAAESSLLAARDAWFLTHGDSDCDHLPRESEVAAGAEGITSTDDRASYREDAD